MRPCRVVLLHSIGLQEQAYDPLRECLSRFADLKVCELRGHGLRAAETRFELADLVQDAVEELTAGTEPVHLVGHSLGGCVAALAAAHAAEFVASLTLVATPVKGLPVFEERALAFIQQPLAAAEATLQRWFGPKAGSDDGVVAKARHALQRTTPTGMAAAWRALASFEGHQAIRQPLPRTLCVAGGDDVSTPPELMRGILTARQAVQPGADIELVTLAGAGHMLPITHPENLASLLLRFWGFEEDSHNPPTPCRERGAQHDGSA